MTAAFLINAVNMVAIYAVLALSLNLMMGYAGLFSVTHGALYGVGAYSFALLELRLGVPFALAFLGAAVLPALAGAVIALPSLRLSGDYLVIASIGLQTVIVAFMMNLTSLTGGQTGLVGIPAPKIGPWEAIDASHYLPLSVGLCLITTVVLAGLVKSPYGRALRMISTDELAAASVGKNVIALKLSAFILGSAMAGLAGATYAGYVTYIDPSSFSIILSIFVMTMVMIGGSGTIFGPIVGAFTVVAIEEALRFVELPASVAGPARQAMYGALLIAFVAFRPQGLIGRVVRRAEDEPDPQPVTVTREPPGPNGHAVPTEEPEYHLECRDLVVSYGGQPVLRGVSIGARSGEVVMVAGHNGSGKSTLLKAISGSLKIAHGQLKVRGDDVTNRQARLTGEERIGLVPQSGGVFPSLTVLENLRLAAYTERKGQEPVQSRIERAVGLFPQLRPMLGQSAGSLSGGQQRMLSLAMAMIPGHRILLLDEPSIGLSPAMIESTLDTVQDLTERLGITTILCEQNVRPALAVSDRAYVLRAGTVALEAPARDLMDNEDLWRLF